MKRWTLRSILQNLEHHKYISRSKNNGVTYSSLWKRLWIVILQSKFSFLKLEGKRELIITNVA